MGIHALTIRVFHCVCRALAWEQHSVIGYKLLGQLDVLHGPMSFQLAIYNTANSKVQHETIYHGFGVTCC